MHSTLNYENTAIKIISAVCGAGKSYALRKEIKKNQQHHNQLIVLPSIALVNQFYSDLNSDGLSLVDKITSDTNPKEVKPTIVKYLSKCLDTNHVLIITWVAFDDLPYFERKNNWRTFIDELPQVDGIFSVDISKNKQLITDFVELGKTINSNIATVAIKPNCYRELKKANESPDDGYKNFRSLYRALLSKNRDVFVSIDEWDAVVNGQTTGIKSGILTFLAMLNPKQFTNTTLLAANIKHSLIYKWFQRFHKVKFIESKKITDALRFTEHSKETGNRVKLHYFLDNRKYSKYCRDLTLEGGKRVGNKMDELAVSFLGESSFLYVINNDYNSIILDETTQAEKISVKSHGLNKYQGYTNIYFNLALNNTPQHAALFGYLGFTEDEIKTANTYETVYQCAMRTSLRDNQSDSTVNIIVPDKYCGEYVSKLLGGCSVQKIEGLNFPVKPTKFTASQRNDRSNFKKVKEKLLSSGAGTDAETESLNNVELVGKKTQKQLLLYLYKEESNGLCNLSDINSKQLAATFHSNKYSKLEEDFSAFIFNTKDFIKELSDSGKTIIDSKDETYLINSAVYDGSIDTEGYRRQKNFIQSHFMILDFDDGKLTPSKFEDIFWIKANKVQKRSFIICNSFSRSKEKPNCFRVFMFYKQAVTSIEQHKMVFDDISNILSKNGFDKETSGLDKVCKTGIQSFYMPCINRKEQEYAFYRKHGLKRTADITRYGIDVDLIAKTNQHINQNNYVDLKLTENDYTINPEVMDNIEVKNIILSIQSMTENRHVPFFDAAIELSKLGLSLTEIEYCCNEMAEKDRKMIDKVPGIMKSVNKYQHQGLNRGV